MHASAALIAGLVAGFAIAMQVGAVSLLLIEASVTAGPRAGVAAGMGVATADFVFAAVAAAAGTAAGAALADHEAEIKLVAAAHAGRDRHPRARQDPARPRSSGASTPARRPASTTRASSRSPP